MRIDSSFSFQNPNHFSTWKRKRNSSKNEKEEEKNNEEHAERTYRLNSLLISKTTQIAVDQPDGSKVLIVTVSAPGESRLCTSIRIADEPEELAASATHIHTALARSSLLNEAL